MSKIRFDRLRKLLEHMERGQLSVGRFDFSVFQGADSCGTMGCMGGELPAVFPGEWKVCEFPADCAEFFSLTKAEVWALFYPRRQAWADLSVLDENATREQVAANLRTFIKREESEEKGQQ